MTMRRLLATAGSVCLVVVAIQVASSSAAEFQWREATPESQGMSSDKLDTLREQLVRRGTKSLLVIRNDRIVYEWYAPGHGRTQPHYTASLAKALVGGVSLAVAMDDNRIALDDPASRFVPQWRADPRKSLITVRQLGSHTSGLQDAWVAEEAARGVDQGSFSGWEGDFWRWRSGMGPDAFSLSRDTALVLFEPGGDFHYSNPGIAMLSYAVTASMRGSRFVDLRSLLRERIMRPIGVPDREWSCGYGKTQDVEGLPLVASWGGGSYSANAVARVGRLTLREGDWEGKRLLSADVVKQTTTDAGTPDCGAMGWWTNSNGDFGKAPRDSFSGQGAGHQVLLVVPSLNLICVRNGSSLASALDSRTALRQFLFDPLMETLTDVPEIASSPTLPYPPSQLITKLAWAPVESIVRKAQGSDNWPLTWADDGDMYTAYGDGNGFQPRVPKKLSVGFAKVSGGATDFEGSNIRSPSGEDVGDGAKGLKASGMLMFKGVLYMWLRNAGNSQLLWSRDHGTTWERAAWKFETSFGCPTFLNFGQNYAGARDEYIYVYSPDGDSAYEPSDQMVLARAAMDRLTDREAYEFFQRLDNRGNPIWTSQIDQRGPVFSHPGHCYRGGITYNAGLRRYLWCQIHPQSTDSRGPRFQGGFGVYESPRPWGPWSTAYFTSAWDVGPGETSSFPTKWISDDGKTMYLVFSGDDCFSVRRADLTIAPAER